MADIVKSQVNCLTPCIAQTRSRPCSFHLVTDVVLRDTSNKAFARSSEWELIISGSAMQFKLVSTGSVTRGKIFTDPLGTLPLVTKITHLIFHEMGF